MLTISGYSQFKHKSVKICKKKTHLRFAFLNTSFLAVNALIAQLSPKASKFFTIIPEKLGKLTRYKDIPNLPYEK